MQLGIMHSAMGFESTNAGKFIASCTCQAIPASWLKINNWLKQWSAAAVVFSWFEALYSSAEADSFLSPFSRLEAWLNALLSFPWVYDKADCRAHAGWLCQTSK